jgi:hypothetical protein
VLKIPPLLAKSKYNNIYSYIFRSLIKAPDQIKIYSLIPIVHP